MAPWHRSPHFAALLSAALSLDGCVESALICFMTRSMGTIAASRHTFSGLTMSSKGDADDDVNVKQVAIIGGGAAGLAAARAFLRFEENGRRRKGMMRSDCVRFEVTVLEARDCVGGIWRYKDESSDRGRWTKSRPMYRNLRTNLPKELMAFREYPWGGDGVEASYVTHLQVQRYLEDYAKEYDLAKCIHFGCKVNHLKVLGDNNDEKMEEEESNCSSWPGISLEWSDTGTGQRHQKTFDNVCVCNGHYALPSSSFLPGLSNFSGRVMHAIEYDDPSEFVGQTVLCVGARASGADIAREIGLVAELVYLSDSTCDQMREFGNVVEMPRTQFVDEQGGLHFSPRGNGGPGYSATGVDAIIFCSGYDYSFPFVDSESDIDLEFVPGERRVRPLFEQLWHARHPSLSFIGLPHSVVPFPLFELQSAAVVAQLTSHAEVTPLPSLFERLASAERDAESGGPDPPGRVQDTHYLGSHQWDYCRRLAKLAGEYDDSAENFIATNKALYDRSGMERKLMVPGGEDLYRETRFRREEEKQSYRILYSQMKSWIS